MFNFDAKFWKTIIPLIIKPGVISKNYVAGKRQRYTNPFRFYLTVSIIFFLILGLAKSIDKFKSLKNGDSKKENNLFTLLKEDNKKIDLDSLKNIVNTELNTSLTLLDSLKIKEITDKIIEEKKDSINPININSASFLGFNLDDFIKYQKKYPDSKIDVALDSLKQEKTFLNRFLYNRAKTISSLGSKKESQDQFISQLLSYGSISLFILLPIFTLFLKLIYIRRKKLYVSHLIFVFHTQTVFFMLLSLYFILEIFGIKPQIGIFAILFLVYLYIAMRKFYNQGYLKTFIKFSLLNIAYFIISSIGIIFVLLISFALY